MSVDGRPEPRLICPARIWRDGLRELRRRGRDWHESGAFLLGQVDAGMRRVSLFVFYDDLDPCCLDSGIVVFDGAAYGALWERCRREGLDVVADVHTHGGAARQSPLDARHPMVAVVGHIAIIVPDFARRAYPPSRLGIYEYEGNFRWKSYLGRRARDFFHIEGTR